MARTPGDPIAGLHSTALRVLQACDGRPMRSRAGLSKALGLSPAAVTRALDSLQRRGLLRIVSMVDPGAAGRLTESLAKLRLDWTKPEEIAALEEELRADPAVLAARYVLGPFDLYVEAAHHDHSEAATWGRDLKARICVSAARVDSVRTRLRRRGLACALGFVASKSPSAGRVAAPVRPSS